MEIFSIHVPNYIKNATNISTPTPERTGFNSDLSILLAFVVGFISFIWIYYETHFYLHKKHYKLQGPRPWPLLGNILSYILTPRSIITREWHKKYGNVFISFLGKSPRINIADPEVARKIFTEDFEYFRNHSVALAFFDKFTRNFLIALQDNYWKRVRAHFSPTFTSSKIRRMFKLINVCSDDLVECINEQIDLVKGGQVKASITTKDIYNLYTLDAISSCCYALKVPREKGDTNIKATASRNTIVGIINQIFTFDKLRTLLGFLLPDFLRERLYETSSAKAIRKFAVYVEKVLEKRNHSSVRYDDYLQILMDSRTETKMDVDENDQLEGHHACITIDALKADHEKIIEDIKNEEKDKLELTDELILANAVFLLIVGLETTSTLLSHITYTLAYHNDVQTKLYDEIKSIAKKSGDTYEFDYQDLIECAYLDALICEDLRFEGPVPSTDRVANDDYWIEKYKLGIPKGTVVVFTYHSIHHNPKYWPEPEVFKPERFLPENRDKIIPGSYTPFGQGPRHCFAMRFSLTETKLALAKLVMHFKFTPKPGYSWPPTPVFGGGLNHYRETQVCVEHRQDLQNTSQLNSN